MKGSSLEAQKLMHKLRLASQAIRTTMPPRELVELSQEAHKLDEHIKMFIGRLIEARKAVIG